MIKAIVILSIAACVSAGVVYDSAHVGAQSEQTVRGLGAFGQSTVSHQAKQVNSAFSSVSKHDTRVINPAVAVQQYAAYQPAVAAPVAYAQPAVAAPVAYAQPAVHHVAAPVAYAQPAVAKVAAPASLLGVAYSAVPQVAHLTFDGFGTHYAY